MIQNQAASRLRSQLEGSRLVRWVGAHNALGVRMAERAGFDGVWSSGLELSASYGVPDASLVTMTEHLHALQAMTHRSDAPIVADCDTGYGDACNAAYAVRRFEAAGAAGLSIEDKCYPKRNSFSGAPEELVSMEEFCGKIESARRARRDDDFVVVARTEALIVGHGPDEALRRAHAYAEAGADAILFHSKEREIEQLSEVLHRWRRKLPVVVVPTTYPQVDAAELGRLGAQVVIYANHGLRASLRAMERIYDEILGSGSARSVEPLLWPLSSVFALQNLGHPLNGDADHGVESITVGSGVATQQEPVPARRFADLLLAEGLDYFAGVPDSTLSSLFLELEGRDDIEYLPAVSEEAAVGVATGCYLAGRSPAVLMQNSGLGTAVTALASLALPYRVPLVLIVGWRGVDGDETPEHRVLGEATPGLLRLLGVPFEIFDPGRPEAGIANVVAASRQTSSPAALVVRLKAVD